MPEAYPCLDILKRSPATHTTLVGIGNSLRSDDGVGSILAQRLAGRLSVNVFDAGMAVENHLGRILRDTPALIVFIDLAQSEVKCIRACIPTQGSSSDLRAQVLEAAIEEGIKWL